REDPPDAASWVSSAACSHRTASPLVVAAARPVILKPPIGIFARAGDCPSRVKQFAKPFAKSVIVLFCTVDEMVVPVTTGFPATRVNPPIPLNGMLIPRR